MVRAFKHSMKSLLKKLQILFVAILTFSLPLQANTSFKNVTLNSTYSSLLQEDVSASDLEHVLLDGGTWDAFIVSDTRINYFITEVVTSPGALGISNNTFTIKNGTDYVFNDTQAATRVTLTNDSNRLKTVDMDNFTLNLTGNKLELKAGVSESSGNLYGALFETYNSGVGNSAVDSNEVNLSANAFSSAKTPELIGGALEITMTDRSLDTTGNVTNNKVTVDALANDPINNSIYAGKLLTDITGFYGQNTYALNTNLAGNQVTLTNGTFGGTIGAAKASLINEVDKAAKGALNGSISSNLITIDGGKYNGAVLVGGWADLEGTSYGFEETSAVTLTNNKILINGGKFEDALIIGAAATYGYTNSVLTGAMSNNKIEISGTPDLKGATLIGAYSNNDNTFSGNTLAVLSKGHTAFGVDGFNVYEFNVSDAVAGDTYLTVTHGNGHNNSFFENYEKSVNIKNRAVNLDNATFSWKGISSRPTGLSLGKSAALLKETSALGITGTIANNGEQSTFVEGDTTYSYRVVQTGNAVNLLHNGISTTGNWTQTVNLSVPDYKYGDLFLNVGGTLTTSSVFVNGSSSASATLTAATLDVTAQDTALVLNNTTPDQVQFNTIEVSNGHSLSKSGSGFYRFNTLNIDGSTTQVNGLDAMNATNVVNLTNGAAPNFGTVNLGNGSTLTISGGTYELDTLNVYGKGATLEGDLGANGKSLNFYLSDTTAAGETALNVTGTADLTDSQITIGILGEDSPLSKNDQFVVVDAAGGMTGEPATQKGVGMQGLLLVYDFDLSVVGNQLVAVVTKAGLPEEAKSFLEGRAASLALVSQGADFAAEQAMSGAIRAATAREDQSLALFTAFGGGKNRYKTGSHVDVNSFNATVGLSHAVSIFGADFVLASFAEYGKGSYHSDNSFPSGKLKGTGDSDYVGIGLLWRYLGPADMYVEGSLRTGSVSNDFKANVFFPDQTAKYHYNAWYYGGHFGLGYLLSAGDDFQLDLYARYLLTAQQRKTVTISSGDKLHFQEAFSSRIRTGLKANFFTVDALQPYIGAALDYEFDGKAGATAHRMSWDAPDLKGASGVGEVGLSWVRGDWSFGVGAEGYAGRRQGISGNVQLGYQF